THMIVSRISNPAMRTDRPIRSAVRDPAKASRCPPGLSTRRHSSHTAGGGTNASQLRPMNPRPSGTCSRSPDIHAVTACAMRSGLWSASPYGGSVITASIEASGSSRSTSRQSPNRRSRLVVTLLSSSSKNTGWKVLASAVSSRSGPRERADQWDGRGGQLVAGLGAAVGSNDEEHAARQPDVHVSVGGLVDGGVLHVALPWWCPTRPAEHPRRRAVACHLGTWQARRRGVPASLCHDQPLTAEGAAVSQRHVIRTPRRPWRPRRASAE